MSDDILDKIDDTLTFYSAGLGEEITVPVGDRAETPTSSSSHVFSGDWNESPLPCQCGCGITLVLTTQPDGSRDWRVEAA